MTLEEAQARILELEEANTELVNGMETLSQNNKELTENLEKVRTLNQKYFNKLQAQYSTKEDKPNDDDKEVLSCEEFAKNLNI